MNGVLAAKRLISVLVGIGVAFMVPSEKNSTGTKYQLSR